MTKRRSVAFILVLAMVLSVLPVTIDVVDEVNAATNGSVDISTDVLTGNKLEIYNEGSEVVASSGSILTRVSKDAGIVITGTSSDQDKKSVVISGKNNAGVINVTFHDLYIETTSDVRNSPVYLVDNAKVNLMLEGNNELICGNNPYAGLEVNENNAITIGGISNNMGSLKAVASQDIYGRGAGIGSSEKTENPSNGPINITAGVSISAIGSSDGAGIGGAQSAQGKDIEISGGTVTAQSGYGAGIGGGYGASGSNINITGGIVNAKSKHNGAGIGGGEPGYGYGVGTNINISGGTVTAQSSQGAGIGGGLNSSASNVNISGGFVSAKSIFGDGIGLGVGASSMPTDIYITGGSVYAHTDDAYKSNMKSIGTTPKGISNNEVFKVDIPLDDYITTGNKDILITSNAFEYKAKTIKSQPNCEHGEGYTSAATIYLPSGTHNLAVDGEEYGKITVNNDGSYSIDMERKYNANISRVNINIPKAIYAGTEYEFEATADAPKNALDGDEAFFPTSWSIGSQNGLIAKDGDGKYKDSFTVDSEGEYTLVVQYEKYTYSEQNSKWESTGLTDSKSIKFNAKPDLNKPGIVLIDQHVSAGDDLYIYNDSNGRVIASSGGVCITSESATKGIMIVGESDDDNKSVIIQGGNGIVNVALYDLSIFYSTKSPVALVNNANVNLTLKGDNILRRVGSTTFAGIEVSEENKISISGYGNENNSLTVAADNGAGIGGSDGQSSGNINVLSGANINISSFKGAGIGGGDEGDGNNITISSGAKLIIYTVYGAGIGGGYNGDGNNIIIHDGADIIIDGDRGAGIGGGFGGTGAGIVIDGGKYDIETTYGSGIGGGDDGNGKNIDIRGGVFNINACYSDKGGGAAIGGGLGGNSENISISGGFFNLNVYIGEDGPISSIGSGEGGALSSNIKILGGSFVLTNNDNIGDATTSFNGKKVYKVDIPIGKDIATGNKDYSINIDGDSSKAYKMKTVKAKPNGEHGDAYNFVATVYLPVGVHKIFFSPKTYREITVNGDNNFTIGELLTISNASKPANVTKIYSPNKNIYIKKGKTMTLPVIASATDSKNPKLTWSTSNKNVATVNQSGKVTGKKKGKAKITVKSENNKSFTFTINVVTKDKKVKKIAVKGFKSTMKKNQSKYLKVTLNPKTATNGKITFKSSKKSVITVDKAGKITAKKKGKAKITVKAGGKKKIITIKVK